MKPIEKVIHEHVFPWMVDGLSTFLKEDDEILMNVEDVMHESFNKSKNLHNEAI